MSYLICKSNKDYEKYLKITIERFKNFINDIDYSSLKVKSKNNNYGEDVSLIKIDKHSDLDKLIYGVGFYIILTNYRYKENECNFEVSPEGKKVKAIYRGHCNRLRKRVESHLFNTKYNINKDNTNFECCMKVIEGQQGIDRDDKVYKNYIFYVIQHKMRNSNISQRECMEYAFDEKFNKPYACKD
ncbi:hypothetical protein M3X99_13070 [Clostridium perfringens]|uniref:hypothetical protein n=1 Tax=Clostridium perfringens TaxID=1502 RepID=UPI00233FC8A1|nr:hypothetical protein [Clostridium perfringens]MDC4251940.1 hypothetical protein [Clostridium perfringens]